MALVQSQWRTLASRTDAQLREQADQLRAAIARRPALIRSRSGLVASLALAAEAALRATGKRLYDVQLLAGVALARGCIAEMQTGEGKTLTTLLPAVCFGLSGHGVHVATTNGYLAARDQAELAAALSLLGLTSAVLPAEHNEPLKRFAYRCDVTFGTGYDFGFDYLRDQIRLRQRDVQPLGRDFLERLSNRPATDKLPLQRAPAFAIVDEADSVLIDEGTMPLILSGTAGERPSVELLTLAASLAKSLREDVDVRIDRGARRIDFTAEGWERVHRGFATGLPPLELRRPWGIYVENALRALHFLQRDVDYVVRGNEVHIVDPLTGRIHDERSWRDGLHQAVEHEEGVPLTPERVSDARITRQRYFQRYTRLCGLTGTTGGVAAELKEFYGTVTVAIPTHRPCRRTQHATRYFASNKARDAAIIAEIIDHRAGHRPVLVGTRTILHSRALSQRLHAAGIPHALLNGTQTADEAAIIAMAGRSGAVTIATNMAGRGTDIRLDEAARHAGGLHVIAAEHHLSRRVDRQLAGRAGRQGDPGSCRVFVSADDELLRNSSGRLAARIRSRADADGEARSDFGAEIANLQERLERDAARARREMVSRDHWLDNVLEALASTGTTS